MSLHNVALRSTLTLVLFFSVAFGSSRNSRGERRDQGRPRSTSYYYQANDRTVDGYIRRSTSARTAFRRSNPCPATGLTTGRCPGYVIDHIVALKRGGPDEPSNMQWQTTVEAEEKDRWE